MFSQYPLNALKAMSIEEIIIYLRKSRQDDPNETIEEVLSRHEMQLQEYAVRTWGAKIPERNIYREIVSGETIDDRPEIKKVLDRVQNGGTKALLVIEPQRLTRGDMLDCGTMVHLLRYTSTICITPQRSYDLDDKYDRRYFEDELKRGNDFLEYTKEILMRGRRLSASQGYWVQAVAPYGYDRERQPNRKYILVANDCAPYVRMIFEWYADGIGQHEITKRLHAAGIKPRGGKTLKWATSTLKAILKNDAYIGIVRYGATKTIRVYENGKLRKKQVRTPESEHIVVKGKHEPIIPLDLWERVQNRLGQCDRTNPNNELINPLAGLLRCKKCGHVLKRVGTGTTKMPTRFACWMNPICDVKSAATSAVLSALIPALHASAAEVEEKIASGAESARQAKAAQLAQLEKTLSKMQEQEEHQYDLLERREYTPEVFNRRHAKLVTEMDSVRAAIEEARATLPDAIDYQEALVKLHDAIAIMENPDASPLEKNIILKTIIDRVDYCREKGAKNNPFELDIILKL